MDGLHSVFNERSRCFRQWYVSMLRIIDISKLTKAGVVPEGYLIAELLRRDFAFAFSDYSGICMLEKCFTTLVKSGALAPCFSTDNLQIAFEAPS